jgi:hypothetical protein
MTVNFIQKLRELYCGKQNLVDCLSYFAFPMLGKTASSISRAKWHD